MTREQKTVATPAPSVQGDGDPGEQDAYGRFCAAQDASIRAAIHADLVAAEQALAEGPEKIAALKKRLDTPPPRAPLSRTDNGGDEIIIVSVGEALVPYGHKTARSRTVFIGGVEHQHVSEHDGYWVYRVC